MAHNSLPFANKTDKNGDAESAFGKFLEENNIKHILARIKHPQTNGKIEKWYDTYEKSRKLFLKQYPDACIGDKGHAYSAYVWISLTWFHLRAAAPRMPRQLCCGVRRRRFTFSKIL
ncbi:MAG: hypothetical protein JW999_05810 [Methanotrichaceae archaeon]|nr:hypothetical protein [Methanotrichaceae archaeon]